MKTYPIPMVPGPVTVPDQVLDTYRVNFGSADLESDFIDLYNQTEARLQQIMGTRNPIAILSGEGMLALWAALKSCLVPGDRVLSIVTGLFGDGIGDMAAAVGADVRKFRLEYDRTLSDVGEIEKIVSEFKPKMITAVHCETPSGTLNPLAGLGRIKREQEVPLFYVDAVASMGGARLLTDDWNIDLCLGASQKCLSAVPNLAFVSVSEAAWETIERIGYAGYDALKPFRSARRDNLFPYTPNWHAVAGLGAAAGMILDEGLENGFARHEAVADFCRRKIAAMGLSLFPAPEAVSSPTVTAVHVPPEIPWTDLDARFRAEGLVVGGNYGPLAGKVFRLGHMGSQADRRLVETALDVIERTIRSF